MKRDRLNDEKCFETSSLPLAAALLVSVPSIVVDHISAKIGIDGRKTIVLRYSIDSESSVQEVLKDFHARSLNVSLYQYNRALNLLRDQLKA